MFYINSEKETFLYTGDFSTRRRYFTEGAKPVKCDNLILECTFGKEEFRFPKIENIIREMRAWISDNFIKDKPVIVFAYSLGKAQELLYHFSEYEPYVAPTIWKINKVFEKHNIKFKCREFPKEIEDLNTKKPYLMLAPLESRNLKHIIYSMQNGAATCAVSGWALSPSFKYTIGVDRAFPISDHADYDELIDFVKKCSPKKVYCWHGYALEFANDIRKKYGLEAIALLNKQSNITSFF
ncbi:MAG: MBL fold metallo-hydrolase RNA specificity domain-containing protein [Thermoplasmata archaeon]